MNLISDLVVLVMIAAGLIGVLGAITWLIWTLGYVIASAVRTFRKGLRYGSKRTS